MLCKDFFDRPVAEVAKDLIGRIIRRKYGSLWLAAAIVETEAYGDDKGNHAWQGRTTEREAMWGPSGTIYMYMSRGGDSLNVSTKGGGHVVLIKGGRPWIDRQSVPDSLFAMHKLNPGAKGKRADHKLLAGQALLARAMDLRVSEWNGKPFDADELFIEDAGYQPHSIIRCRRLGLPDSWDPDLMLRYVDEAHLRSATQNPLGKRNWTEGRDYQRLTQNDQA